MKIRTAGIAIWTLALVAAVTIRSARVQEKNPERNAYFGETHVHTSWSFDAFIFGNHITGPADAYKYFKGETIKHPLGYDIKITTPLDWAGVTDHSEYVGTVRLAQDSSSPISKLPIAKQLQVHDAADVQRIYLWLGTAMIEGNPVKELLVPSITHTVLEQMFESDRVYLGALGSFETWRGCFPFLRQTRY